MKAQFLKSDHLILGNLRPFTRDLLNMLERSRQLGSFTKFRLLNTTVYFVTDPDLVEVILSNKDQVFIKNQRFTKRLQRLFGQGLLTAEGDQWKKLRKLSAPAFQPRSTNSYIPIINKEVAQTLDEWRSKSHVNISIEMSNLTARIITKCIFGLDLTVSGEAMGNLFHNTMIAITDRVRERSYMPEWVPTRKKRAYHHTLDQLDDFIYNNIQQRIENDQVPEASLLWDLIQAAKLTDTLSDGELRDQIVTLFLAGHETTASTLAFCFILLSQAPDIYQRLNQEVSGVDLQQLTNLNEIKAALPLTYNVIRESMRLYPPAYIFGRQPTRDYQLGDELIKKGALIFLSPYIMHRDPNVFKNPEAFDPDRWQMLELSRQFYMPFSSGQRTCIGEYLANLEACLILAGIVQAFDVQCDQEPIVAKPFLTLRPGNNLNAVVSGKADL